MKMKDRKEGGKRGEKEEGKEKIFIWCFCCFASFYTVAGTSLTLHILLCFYSVVLMVIELLQQKFCFFFHAKDLLLGYKSTCFFWHPWTRLPSSVKGNQYFPLTVSEIYAPLVFSHNCFVNFPFFFCCR